MIPNQYHDVGDHTWSYDKTSCRVVQQTQGASKIWIKIKMKYLKMIIRFCPNCITAVVPFERNGWFIFSTICLSSLHVDIKTYIYDTLFGWNS